MRERVQLRRPHPRLMVVRTIRVMRSAWIVVGVAVALDSVLPSGWRIVLLVAGVYYAWTRVFQVFHEYVAIRYSGDARGVSVIRGIIGREEKCFAWESIVTVSVTQTMLQRVLRLAEVRMNFDAPAVASETLPGVRVAEAARLVRLHSQHRGVVPVRSSDPVTSVTGAPDSPSASSGTITPVLAPVDFLLIGLYSGVFVLFVPSVYSVAAEVRAAIGLPPGALPTVHDVASVGSGAVVVVVLAGALLSVAYGACVSWLRYRRFAVTLRPNGDLVFAAGLSDKERRVIAVNAVAAYELRRPLLMAPARRAFLRAVVRGEAGHVTRGMLLPMTRSSEGVDVLCRLTGLSSRALRRRTRSGRAAVAVGVTAAIAACAVALIAVSSVGTALVVGALSVLLLRGVDTRIGSIRVVPTAAADRWIVVDRGILFRSTWVISSVAVDVFRWSGLDRRHGALTISIRGRRAVRLHVWPTSPRLALQLRRAVQSPTPISFERNSR